MKNVPTTYPVTTNPTLRGYAEYTYPIDVSGVTEMGLGRVELPTSRLSGAQKGKSATAVDGESDPLAPTRPQQRENEARPKQTSGRTRRVPANVEPPGATGYARSLVRPLAIGFGSLRVWRAK